MRINALLLIIAGCLNQLAPFMEWLQPSLTSERVHPFINYTWPHDAEGIPILWWVKYCTDDFQWVLTMFVLTKVAAKYSFRMFQVAGVWFMYHVFDSFMLWYNYRQSNWLYWVVLLAIVVSTVLVFLPERRTGQVKSMN